MLHEKTYKETHKKKNFNLVFFDLECTQDTPRGDAEYQHVPNLCISENVCNKCIASTEEHFSCRECEGKQRIFFSENCVAEFVDFLDEFVDEKVVCIAHNLSGYDGMFLLAELAKRDFPPNRSWWVGNYTD